MQTFERALDIVLDPREPEQRGFRHVTPVSATESLVATRGLPEHLAIMYDGVLKRSGDEEKALEVIYDFLTDKVDSFRSRAINLAAAFNTETAQLEHSRAYTASAIAILLRGSRSHRTGVWLKGQASEDQLRTIFSEVMSADPQAFDEMAMWGHKQAWGNLAFWRAELEETRLLPIVGLLRGAIETSDHEVEV